MEKKLLKFNIQKKNSEEEENKLTVKGDKVL